jgi:hypothetical protein
VTALPSGPSSRLPDAPDPYADPAMIRTWAGYRQAIGQMTMDQLIAHATDLSARLEQESQRQLGAFLSQSLADQLQALDRLQVRSPRTAPQASPRDRGAQASQTSQAPRLPSAVDLLARSKSLAPRIAAKLVAAEARRAARSRE